MTQQILIFIASCLPVFIGFKLYDVYRTRWQYVYKGPQREHLSKIWHAIGFWTVLLTVLVNALALLPFYLIIEYGPLAGILAWIIYDIVWNIFNNEKITYPGNGGGSFYEIIFTWLSNRIGFYLTFWNLISKFILFVLTLIWAFKENL